MDILSDCPECGYSLQPFTDDHGGIYYVCTNCRKVVTGSQSKDHEPVRKYHINIKF